MLPPQLPTNPLPNPTHLRHIHARPQPQTLQEIHHLLRRDIARRPRTKRTAAQPAHGRIEHAHPMLERDQRVHQRHRIGIMKMQRQILGPDARRTERRQQLLGARRRAHARRVRDADLVGAHLEQAGRHVGHGLRRRRVGPFEGAAEGDGDVGARAQVVRFGVRDQRPEAREGFGDAAVGVALGEGFGGGAEEGDFVGGLLGEGEGGEIGGGGNTAGGGGYSVGVLSGCI